VAAGGGGFTSPSALFAPHTEPPYQFQLVHKANSHQRLLPLSTPPTPPSPPFTPHPSEEHVMPKLQASLGADQMKELGRK
jgi:hypothetical protein